MKFIMILLLAIGSAAQAQDSPMKFADTVSTYNLYNPRTDTIKGSLILAYCTGCLVQSRPALMIRKGNGWADSTTYHVRDWHRKWLFGKIIFTYHPPKQQWVLINFVPCE